MVDGSELVDVSMTRAALSQVLWAVELGQKAAVLERSLWPQERGALEDGIAALRDADLRWRARESEADIDP